jgi:group I intron endonuclease
MSVSGIYKIINKTNGKYYVGSSTDLAERWIQHKQRIKYQTHPNSHLQNAWNKYGESAFDFVIVEKVPKEKLIEVEQKYLDLSKNEQDRCYNQNFSANAVLVTDEMKEKISNSLRKHYTTHRSPMYGKVHSSNSIEKMRIIKIGKTHLDSSKKKISKALKGIIRSNETRHKISLCKKGTNNCKYDHTIYRWYNTKINETFDGTQQDFHIKYNFPIGSVNFIVKGKRNSLYGWKIVKA